LVVFVALLAARLRAASATIAELRDQRDRDIDTIATAREELIQMTEIADDNGRVQAALADAQAALAAVRAERDLARAQAEAAQRQRHAFLSALAHDLRNPLAPLSNGIELLRLTDNDPAGRLRTRGIMERQVGHLMRIADELSDLARLSGDHANLQSTPFDLGALLQSLAERLAPTLHAQEMTLAIGPELLELPPLRGDAQRLSQAFGHLVADLARHAERGSTVQLSGTVEEGRVAVLVATAADADDEVTAALEDVEAAKLGLGVSLADQLVALHDGHLQAQRPAGARRARFTVTLPLDESAPAVARTAPQAGMRDTVLSVLLADDNVDFSHSFGTMLELLGHRVEVVHDGLAAVASIVASPPDIAFVDIGMPALDGVETVRRVRGQGNTHDVLLVAVTGRGGAEDRARAAEAGFDRYLVKPFAMQDVRDALDAAQAIRSGASERAPGGFAPSRVA
jgi:signal transduction histidine kinase/CheY-like chemotaxis protein